MKKIDKSDKSLIKELKRNLKRNSEFTLKTTQEIDNILNEVLEKGKLSKSQGDKILRKLERLGCSIDIGEYLCY